MTTYKELTEVPSVVYQREMRRAWWIAYSWEEITEAQDSDRKYLRCLPRPINEAEEAARNFDLMLGVSELLKAKE